MKKIFFFPLALIFFVSCEHENWQTVIAKAPPVLTPCDTLDSVRYGAVIAPLMINSCGSTDNACHTYAGAAGSQYDLSNYTAVSNVVNMSHSPFIGAITNDGTTTPMPKAGYNYSLSLCDRNKILIWINQGALNN